MAITYVMKTVHFTTKTGFSRYMKATYLPSQKFSCVAEIDSQGRHETFYIKNTPVAHINKTTKSVEAYVIIAALSRKTRVCLSL